MELTIVSKAPYTAIEPPTPDTPSAGVAIFSVNSALKWKHAPGLTKEYKVKGKRKEEY